MHLERSEQAALLGLAAAVVVGILFMARSSSTPGPVLVSTPSPPASQVSVHVVGEVVWPGLYVLKAGSRIQDAIFAAHGPTYIADLRRVNLAAVLRDGDRVVIPRLPQPTGPAPVAPTSTRANSHQGVGPVQSSAGETPRAVNVNTATAADLEQLPGVGPVLARRIVEYREARGLFRRMDDLLDVQGVGPKLLRRLEPLLRLDDEGTTPTVPP